MKNCPGCNKNKPFTDFWKTKDRKDGLQVYCKKCLYRKNRECIQRNPEIAANSVLNSHLKRTYNITLEQFNQMSEAQNHLCSVCKQLPMKHNKRLFVDHCHATGKVRGLLCQNCNVALGAILDNPEIAYRLADYLIKSKELVTELT